MSSARVVGLLGQLAEDLVLEVVVLEVLARQRAHHRREPQHPAGLRAQLRVVRAALVGGLDEREQVGAVVLRAHAPRAVVEPDARHVELRGVEPGGLGDLLREDDRPLAERDERDVGVVADGLRDEVDRVRVVEDPRGRGDGLEVLEDPLHDVDRAQRHEEAARPLRLLPDDAVRERDPLVEHARLEAAGAVGRQDGVDAVEPGAAVGRGRHREVDALRRRHPLREVADQLEALRVEVDQHDLRAGEVLALLDEARHRARSAGRPAADVGDLQSCHLLLQRARVVNSVPSSRLRHDRSRPKPDRNRPTAAGRRHRARRRRHAARPGAPALPRQRRRRRARPRRRAARAARLGPQRPGARGRRRRARARRPARSRSTAR